MNTQTGDIFIASDEDAVKTKIGVPITPQEHAALGKLSNIDRLRRYKQIHADDRCQKCALILREHTLKEWQYCQWVLSGGSLQSEIGKG